MTRHSRSQAKESFWFRPISSAGFGLMRIGFGVVTFVTYCFQWSSIQWYFGPEGILPHTMISPLLRNTWRFSLLDTASSEMVSLLFLLFLLSLIFVSIGLFTRLALIVSVVLLYSFHEYGSITLDGGDTLLRLIGFIVLISPCDRSFSIDNLLRRFHLATTTGKVQPATHRTMPIWSYRLFLWQMILLYGSSFIEKIHGNLWRDGSAVAIVLHHGIFSRLPLGIADSVTFLSPILSYFTLLTQAGWLLLLPLGLLSLTGKIVGTKGFDTWKRTLLLCGILIHGGILLLMNVGTFSLTVFTAYCGVLTDNDFLAIRKVFNRGRKTPLTVLYDGRCGFCTKTVIILQSFDWLHRLAFANFHDRDVRKKYAPKIELSALKKAMHVRLIDRSHVSGFYAFRALCKDLPPLWILWPFLYLPLVPAVGEKAYTWVAGHRR